jgi:hypothetical protein
MVSRRSHRRIEVPADRAWALLSDSALVPTWFQSIKGCVVTGDRRVCRLAGGATVTEQILTCDDELRRFQYSIAEGIPVDTHRATIDVIALDEGVCVVVYSTDVTPDRFGAPMGDAVEEALDAVKALLEEREAFVGGSR